jgi:hypothetical protein
MTGRSQGLKTCETANEKKPAEKYLNQLKMMAVQNFKRAGERVALLIFSLLLRFIVLNVLLLAFIP